MIKDKFIQTIRQNCDISDARDNGIYSICMLVLKLRNLYKWEHGIEPWDEPDSGELLDWIENKENYWETIAEKRYHPLEFAGREEDPYEILEINKLLQEENLLYGAGYGRSMKSIFFLAKKIREETVEGCPVVILGRESARELSSPFAMLQDGTILIRRDPLRFFFWDHIQEIRSSGKKSLHHALGRYEILTDGQLDQDAFKNRLDTIVDEEIPIFIYHEVGEMKQQTFDSETLRKIIATFPDSAIEYVSRAVKDVLADTHPEGMVRFIISEQRDASLGFYVGFLAGLRRILSPEIIEAFEGFLDNRDWQTIEKARARCRDNNLHLADTIREIADRIGKEDGEQIKLRFYEEILTPLGLEVPEAEE
jgi:hypothetical protein